MPTATKTTKTPKATKTSKTKPSTQRGLTTTTAAPAEPSYTPPLYDPAAGKEALEALAPELDRISEDDFATLKIDVEMATYAVLGAVGFVTSSDVRRRFAALPREYFDMAHVDGLGPVCFAMLYALAEARAAGALETDAKLPTALVEEATAIEARMQALCEYQFEDDPAIKPEVDRLRPGTGYRDLANDLLGYARIYELRADVVKADTKHYRAGDAARARELGGAIIQKLSSAMTPKARAAYDRYVRVWTLLVQRYEEVRATGLWLFRNDGRALSRFPSLFAVGRPNVGRSKKAAPEEVEEVEGEESRSPDETENAPA